MIARWLFALLTLAAWALPSTAADTPVGNWRMGFQVVGQGGRPLNVQLLFMFSEADGKWIGDFVDCNLQLGKEEPTVNLKVADDKVSFTMKFGPNNWSFDGKLQPGAKKINGSMQLDGDNVILVEMAKTTLKSISKDRFAVQKDVLDNADTTREFFEGLYPVLTEAGAKKLKPEEVRAYADKAAKLAESYGPRWQRLAALRIADTLASQEAYVAIAVEQARQAERLLDRGDSLEVQMTTLDSLARVLRKAKKDTDAQEVESRIAKLEPRDFAEYAKTNPPFKPEEFKGRKGKSDRVMLVELFTGAECEPCVAADLACDALTMSFKPTEVVVLQYHMHIPGPDALVCLDSDKRFGLYAKDNEKSTPALYLNGKAQAAIGGAARQAKLKYQALREAIEPMLEAPGTVKLQASAILKGDEIAIKANIADLEKPGEKVTLRFAITEERVRYTGGNGIRYHHNVVRIMPGGIKGFAMTKKAAEQTATVKLDEIKVNVNKALDEIEEVAKKEGADFKFSVRPLALKNLKLVAFIQNDETKEVLQAVQVDVELAK